MNIYKLSIYIILALSLSGSLTSCAIFNYDISTDPTSELIFNKCYITSKPTKLYWAKKWGFPETYLLQTIDPNNKYVPITWKHINSFKEGSKFIITKVIDTAQGETGRCIRVKAKFIDYNKLTEELLIPSCDIRDYEWPIWIKNTNPIQFNRQFAIPCTTSELHSTITTPISTVISKTPYLTTDEVA